MVLAHLSCDPLLNVALFDNDEPEEESQSGEDGLGGKKATKTMTSWSWDGGPRNKANGIVAQLWWTRAQLNTSYLQASAVM